MERISLSTALVEYTQQGHIDVAFSQDSRITRNLRFTRVVLGGSTNKILRAMKIEDYIIISLVHLLHQCTESFNFNSWGIRNRRGSFGTTASESVCSLNHPRSTQHQNTANTITHHKFSRCPPSRLRKRRAITLRTTNYKPLSFETTNNKMAKSVRSKSKRKSRSEFRRTIGEVQWFE